MWEGRVYRVDSYNLRWRDNSGLFLDFSKKEK
jgi:hypothetical protein